MKSIRNILIIISFLIGTAAIANVPGNELLKIIENDLIFGDFESEEEIIEVATKIYYERNPEKIKEIEATKEKEKEIMKKFDDMEAYYKPFNKRVFENIYFRNLFSVSSDKFKIGNEAEEDSVYILGRKLSYDSLNFWSAPVKKNLKRIEEDTLELDIALIGSSRRYENDLSNVNIKQLGIVGSVNYGLLERLTTSLSLGLGYQNNDFSYGNKTKGCSYYVGLNNIYENKLYNQPHSFFIKFGVNYQKNDYDVDTAQIRENKIYMGGEDYKTNSHQAYLNPGFKYVLEDIDLSIIPSYEFNVTEISQDNMNKTKINSSSGKLEFEKTLYHKEWDIVLGSFAKYERNLKGIGEVVEKEVFSTGAKIDIKSNDIEYNINYNYSSKESIGGIGVLFKF